MQSQQAIICPSFFLFSFFASIRFRFLASFSSSLHLASFFFSNTSWYLLDVVAYGCLSICLFPLRFDVSGHTRNSFIPSVWTTFITRDLTACAACRLHSIHFTTKAMNFSIFVAVQRIVLYGPKLIGSKYRCFIWSQLCSLYSSCRCGRLIVSLTTIIAH